MTTGTNATQPPGLNLGMISLNTPFTPDKFPSALPTHTDTLNSVFYFDSTHDQATSAWAADQNSNMDLSSETIHTDQIQCDDPWNVPSESMPKPSQSTQSHNMSPNSENDYSPNDDIPQTKCRVIEVDQLMTMCLQWKQEQEAQKQVNRKNLQRIKQLHARNWEAEEVHQNSIFELKQLLRNQQETIRIQAIREKELEEQVCNSLLDELRNVEERNRMVLQEKFENEINKLKASLTMKLVSSLEII
ncbi:hypothetical protein K439DRAFT_1624326 [Ramaria rubella]|nr:hypothetical protein K439DRAFT_1624326 [Ramaria rubella]